MDFVSSHSDLGVGVTVDRSLKLQHFGVEEVFLLNQCRNTRGHQLKLLKISSRIKNQELGQNTERSYFL